MRIVLSRTLQSLLRVQFSVKFESRIIGRSIAPCINNSFNCELICEIVKMVSVFVILLLSLLCGLFYFIQKRRNYWRDTGLPFMESSFPFRMLSSNSKKMHSAFLFQNAYKTLQAKVADLYYGGMYFFITPVVLAVDLNFIKTILVKDFQYFHDRGLYYNEEDDPISAHLLNLEGNRWKSLRAKLTPTFSSGKMKMMFPTVIEVAHQFEKFLGETVIASNEVEIKDVLARFTTDVIGSCAFGLECNSLKDPNNEFRLMGKKVFDNPRYGPVTRLFVLTFRELARKFHLKLVPDDVSDFFMGVVKDTIEYREKNNVQRNDFVNLLMQLKDTGAIDDELNQSSGSNGDSLTINEIAAQAFVFFLAGFETSSTAMSYALYELSQNMEVQEKARASVRETLQKYGGKWTYEAVSEMTYLDQCINGEYEEINEQIRL